MATTVLGLPELEAAQNQKYLTVNNALQRLDILVNLTVFNSTTATPPASPNPGDRYIVGPSATGAWAGQEGNVAARIGTQWIFFTPSEGWRAYDQGNDSFLIYDGSSWTELEAGLTPTDLSDGSVTMLGVNGAADTTNRFTVHSEGVIFNRLADNIDIIVNKEETGDDARFRFTTAWETKALFGLLGSDHFGIQVTPDGLTFHQAINIHNATGNVAIGAGADANNKLLVSGESCLFTNNGNMRFTFSKGATGDDAALTFQTNFSGRALIGLLGSDDFTFTVSPDGSAYTQALIINKDTAAISFPQHPKFSALLNFGQNYSADTWHNLGQNIARHNDQGALTISSNVGTFTAPHDGYYLFGVGATYESPGTTPDVMQVGLSVNGAAPLADTYGTTGDAALTSFETAVNTTALLKLSAGDTVNAAIQFKGAQGRVAANENYFWGTQIA